MPDYGNQIYNGVYSQLAPPFGPYTTDQATLLANLAVAQSQQESGQNWNSIEATSSDNNVFGYNYVGQTTGGITQGRPQPGGGYYAAYPNVTDSGAEIGRYLNRHYSDFSTVTDPTSYVNALAKNSYFLNGTPGEDVAGKTADYLSGVSSNYYRNKGLGPLSNTASDVTNVNYASDFLKPYSAPSIAPPNDLSLLNELANLNANISNIENDNSYVTWGSRSDKGESSDWIGLRQFIMYLASRYYPQSFIPFVELIPVFFIDQPQASNAGMSALETDLNTNDISRFNAMRTSLIGADGSSGIQANGGIDLMTLDPFQDYSTGLYMDNAANTALKSTSTGRGFGYRILGSLVMSPSANVGSTSKAGAIGFKSIEVQAGLQLGKGLSLITLKLLDVQGNKFFDIASPWSFLINPPKQAGDFYFRYGWQLRIPKDDKDINSSAYKFWNHPGWILFDNGTLKQDIMNKAAANDYTISLTQSNSINSLWYPGYTIKTVDDIAVFQIDRQLTIEHYGLISILSSDITVNSQDGSLSADVHYRYNNTFANCFCPINLAMNMHKLANDKNGLTTNLLDFISAFLNDNFAFLKQDQNYSQYSNNAINPNSSAYTNPNGINTSYAHNQRPTAVYDSSWLQVRRVNHQNITTPPHDIHINITGDDVKFLTTNINAKNSDTLLLTWVQTVLSNNHMTVSGPGDSDLANPNGRFFIIWDDPVQLTDESVIKQSSILSTSQTQFIGVTGTNRLVIPDDVFSFRFMGSLVEDIKIKGNPTPTGPGIQGAQNAANNINKDVINPPDVPTTGAITFEQKRTEQNYYLTTLRNADIKAIAHPWLSVGDPAFMKGTGLFDGQYVISTVKHILSEDGKFISEISCVKSIGTEDYNSLLNSQKKAAYYAQENANTNIAQPISDYNDFQPAF